ncbi:MAG: methionyl-tRNA formyltransferase [Acidobacteriota bacterium]
MRLVFFGDGAWAAKSLVRLHQDGHEIPAVVVRRRPTSGEPAETARSLGMPVLQPADANSAEFVARLRGDSPELNLSVSYDQIIRRPLLQAAPLGFVNFHAGKLPRYRGRNVVNWALINGETEIGLTAHFMDEGIDTGDIILQRTLPIGWIDTYGDVLSRVVDAFPDLVADTLSLLQGEAVPRKPQASLAGTYFAGREPGDEWLDWSDTSRNLHNKVRGISRPGPGARTKLGEKTVIVWRALWEPSWPGYLATPGQVVERKEGEGVVVKTGDSTLLVTEIEADPGLVGRPSWRVGTRLGVRQETTLEALRADVDALKRRMEDGQP